MTRIIKYTAAIVASALASEAFTGKWVEVIENATFEQHLRMNMHPACYPLCYLPRPTNVIYS
jgi:hypothetical protein